jgi:Tfp pilus assembly protein PilO
LSNPAIEKLAMLSRQQTIIGAVIVAAAYFMFFYNSGQSFEAKLQANQKQIADTKAELKKYEKAKEDAKAYKQSISEEGPKFETILRFLPEELSEFQVMELLSTEAKAAGARLKGSFSNPVKNDKDSLYHSLSVKLQLEVTYTQLLLFLSYISKVDRVIALKNFTINKKNLEVDGEMLLDVTAEFHAYKYNPESSKSEVKKYAK